ncbi:nitronate monooxygenase [Nonomuraea angiospora]|uniref:nitronate monooxygenase n=1 Tax=Nonomuraea angiospora TaxID=46172 RepID=UPI00344F5C99
MALTTEFTGLFGVRHPIALAPMGGPAGGALTAAVSNGGGLLLGSGNGDPDWLARELPIVTQSTGKPWGVGFQAWAIEAVDLITDLPCAADLVAGLAPQAENALHRAGRKRAEDRPDRSG